MVVRGLPSGSCWDDEADTQRPLPGAPTVGVLDRGILNQLVNLYCVFSERTRWLTFGKWIRKYLLDTYVLNAFQNDSGFSPLQHIP